MKQVVALALILATVTLANVAFHLFGTSDASEEGAALDIALPGAGVERKNLPSLKRDEGAALSGKPTVKVADTSREPSQTRVVAGKEPSDKTISGREQIAHALATEPKSADKQDRPAGGEIKPTGNEEPLMFGPDGTPIQRADRP